MHLIEKLMDQVPVTRQQAEGGAGLLLRRVQARVSDEEFQRVADTIPAISDIIGKAPRQAELGWWRTAWLRWFTAWGPLAPLKQGCEKLGLERNTVNKFIAVIGQHFRDRGGPELESLLLSAWR